MCNHSYHADVIVGLKEEKIILNDLPILGFFLSLSIGLFYGVRKSKSCPVLLWLILDGIGLVREIKQKKFNVHN